MRKLILASELDILFPKIANSTILNDYTKAAFIPTASLYKEKDYKSYFKDVVAKQFSSLSIQSEIVEISNYSPKELEKKFEEFDIIYVGGGNTFYLLDKINQCNFQNALEKVFSRNGLYIGSSAGSVVTCPNIEFIAAMDEPNYAPQLDNYKGLGYIDRPLIPHLGHEKYSHIAHTIQQGMIKANKPHFCLKDDEGLYINDNMIELIA